jgi:hypothetical protein
MLTTKVSPNDSESTSTSNTDYASSSTESVNPLFKDLVDLKPPKASARAKSKEALASEDESPSQIQESFEEEYSGPYPKPKSGHTRRLIQMVRIPADGVDENFDEDAWNKKVYGPDVIIVDMHSVPKGWILVDGNAPVWNAC